MKNSIKEDKARQISLTSNQLESDTPNDSKMTCIKEAWKKIQHIFYAANEEYTKKNRAHTLLSKYLLSPCFVHYTKIPFW